MTFLAHTFNRGFCIWVLGVAVRAFADPVEAGADGWDALDLAVAKVEGGQLHYERCFENDIPLVLGILEDSLRERPRLAREMGVLKQQSDKIIDRLDQILGRPAQDADAGLQRRFLGSFIDGMLTFAPHPNSQAVDFYLVRASTLKDHLRAGHALPDFKYNRAKDDARYECFISFRGAPKRLPLQLPLVIKGERPFETELKTALESTRFLHEHGVITVLHELVEFSILLRLKPIDPYFRWFSDGFANALAVRLTKEFVPGAALEVQEAQPYVDLAQDINLLYWTAEGWNVRTPLESERRLEQARYAFATLEANRMLDRYGVGIVKKVLDAACTAERNDSRQLLDAFRTVTGEDLREEFKRYQRFATKEEGIARYTEQAMKAVDEKNEAAAFPHVLRRMELREMFEANDYLQAACLLFRMGYEEDGDRAILSQLERHKDAGGKLRLATAQAFIVYSLRCNKASKAEFLVDEVLKNDPGFVPALVVLLQKHVRERAFDQARAVANRILRLDNGQDPNWRRMAEGVLRSLPRTPARPSKDTWLPGRIELRPNTDSDDKARGR
ncbi:MAG: hypothetical protein AMXMBFR13_34210 [Phycisphaerae bacterium]